MGGAKRTTWIAGTVVVALLMLVASWFLAIMPKLSDASDVRAQAQQTRDQNDLLELKLTQLKADFEKLDEYKAELAGLQQQIPTQEQLAEYLRQLDAIATAQGVTITVLTPAVPEAVVLAAPAAATTTTESTDGTSSTDDSSSTDESATTDTTAPVASGVPTGFMAIPVQMTAVGTYDATSAFLSDLQNGTQRLFLVSALQGTSQDDAESSGGKPATGVGDLEIIVTGYLYVLPDSLGTAAVVDPAAPAPTLPGAVPGKNPLVPIPGR